MNLTVQTFFGSKNCRRRVPDRRASCFFLHPSNFSSANTPRIGWLMVSREQINIAETGVTYLQNSNKRLKEELKRQK